MARQVEAKQALLEASKTELQEERNLLDGDKREAAAEADKLKERREVMDH